MMNIKLFVCQFLLLLSLLSIGCKKEQSIELPENEPELLVSKPEGLYEVITFSFGPSFWESCQERDTIMISKTENGITIEDSGLGLDLDTSKSTNDFYYFVKEFSNIENSSLIYYPDCDSIEYRDRETWTSSSDGYKGRKLGTAPCVPAPSFTNCSEVSANQICINARSYILEYGAITPHIDDQVAFINLWAHIPLNADSTDVTSDRGNILGFQIPFTGMDDLARSYNFSDGSLIRGGFYEETDFFHSIMPSSYYVFDQGTLHIENQNDEYIFTFDLGHCVMVQGTGYYDGVLLEW